MTRKQNDKFGGFVLAIATTLSASGIVAVINLAMTVVRLDEKLRNLGDCGKPRHTAQVTVERRPTVLSAMGFEFLQKLFVPEKGETK